MTLDASGAGNAVSEAGTPPATDATAGAKRRVVAVVPHTHWDREWYDPFQTFRLKLVRLIDDLLDLLEGDPSYRHFLLDGQVAVIDDYLEIRPEHEARLRALATSGRITIGPWYILMDEFLVSGETIIRDLQAGIRRGAAFGGVMDVGYLPDMFGHVAQMPQILRAAGLEHAVVWRGVPSAVEDSAFRWTSPDGSSVRAEYLVAGYGNGAAVPDDAKALVRRLNAHVEELGSFLAPGAPLLLMNGTDHQRPQPWLGRVVDEVNQMQDELTLAVMSLPEYLELATSAGADSAHEAEGAEPPGKSVLTTWQGELRSGFRSNLLMGVGSNRVDVKQAAARAERSLERMAEPLSALFLPPASWPGTFLDVAWKLMIRNAAHDSVCACSADEVVDAVLNRYAEARQIGDGLAAAALEALGGSMATPGTVVVNPSARDRGGMVEVVIPATAEPRADVQVISERAGLPGTITLDGTTVKNMLGMITGSRIDDDTYVTDVAMTGGDEDSAGIDIAIVVGTTPRDGVPIEEIKRELFTRLTARPDTEVRVALDQPPVRRVLARQIPVPGFGWAPFTPAPLHHPVHVPVRVADDGDTAPALSNGLIAVAVDTTDGTFSINGIAGYGRLVDGGDYGDTYNYSPPAGDSTVDTPDAVTATVDERGPVRGTITIRSTMTWPDRVDDSRQTRVGAHRVEVFTTVELRADERLVRVRTTFDNPSKDHRVRVHLPLPEPASVSRAECAFTVVERGLTAEGRPDEIGMPTFPSRRFVSAGGLTVVHEGLLEYELIDIDGADAGADGSHPPGSTPAATTLALTLLRSTGMLSRLGMAMRPLPAGPLNALHGPQLIGPIDVRYALGVGEIDPYALADDALVPLATTGSFGGGNRPDTGSALIVRGAEVSAVQRDATGASGGGGSDGGVTSGSGALELRVFNPHDVATTVQIDGRSGWLVDLRGRLISPFDGSFDLRAHGIATVRLTGI